MSSTLGLNLLICCEATQTTGLKLENIRTSGHQAAFEEFVYLENFADGENIKLLFRRAFFSFQPDFNFIENSHLENQCLF